MNFARNVLGLFATDVVNIPIGILGSIVLARFLSVDDRGLYAVATSFAVLAMLVSNLGWPPATIYRLLRVRSEPAKVTGAAFLASAFASTWVILLCLAFKPYLLHRFLDDAPQIVLYLTLGIFALQLLALILGAVARGIDRFAYWNWYRLALAVGTLLATVFAIVIRDGALIEALVAVLVTRGVLTLLLAVAVVAQTGITWKIGASELLQSSKHGLKIWVHGVSGEVHERVDVFMITYFLGDPVQLAYYAIAASLVQRLKLVPGAIKTAAYPKMVSLDDRELIRFVCSVSRQSLMWVFLTAAALGLSANFLVPLAYGEEYRASITPFLILLPGMVVLTTYQIISRYYVAIDRQRTNILTQIFSVIMNIGLNAWLIPRYGILGAASASVASYTFEATVITIAFIANTGQKVSNLFVPRRTDFEPYQRRLDALTRRLRSSP